MSENSYQHPDNIFIPMLDVDPIFYAFMDCLIPYDNDMFAYVIYGEEI